MTMAKLTACHQILGLCCLLCLPSTVSAQQLEEPPLTEDVLEQDQLLDESAEGGIIVNQTMTLTGSQFYRNFLDYWREQKKTLPSNLVIYERPSVRWGNLILIEYNQKTLLRFFINNRIDNKILGKNAVLYVVDRISDFEIEKIFIDQDMDTDEL